MTVQNELFKIEWSEFHYHLFSYLMSAECPRELAEGLDLQLFPCSPEPNKEKMDACVQACIDSEDSVDLQDKLTHLLAGWKLAEAFNVDDKENN
jgi:hypothetical protein